MIAGRLGTPCPLPPLPITSQIFLCLKRGGGGRMHLIQPLFPSTNALLIYNYVLILAGDVCSVFVDHVSSRTYLILITIFFLL